MFPAGNCQAYRQRTTSGQESGIGSDSDSSNETINGTLVSDADLTYSQTVGGLSVSPITHRHHRMLEIGTQKIPDCGPIGNRSTADEQWRSIGDFRAQRSEGCKMTSRSDSDQDHLQTRSNLWTTSGFASAAGRTTSTPIKSNAASRSHSRQLPSLPVSDPWPSCVAIAGGTPRKKPSAERAGAINGSEFVTSDEPKLSPTPNGFADSGYEMDRILDEFASANGRHPNGSAVSYTSSHLPNDNRSPETRVTGRRHERMLQRSSNSASADGIRPTNETHPTDVIAAARKSDESSDYPSFSRRHGRKNQTTSEVACTPEVGYRHWGHSDSVDRGPVKQSAVGGEVVGVRTDVLPAGSRLRPLRSLSMDAAADGDHTQSTDYVATSPVATSPSSRFPQRQVSVPVDGAVMRHGARERTSSNERFEMLHGEKFSGRKMDITSLQQDRCYQNSNVQVTAAAICLRLCRFLVIAF